MRTLGRWPTDHYRMVRMGAAVFCIYKHSPYSRLMRWFRKAVDVRPIYDTCMEDGAGFRLSATEVSVARDSPFSLFCRYHADPSKRDSPDPFLRALSAKGVEHESDVLESDYPKTEQVSYATPEEAFMAALRSMAGGTKALSNFPLFYLPEGMYGYADVLERHDGESAFGKHHYVVREIKVAINIRESHIIQAAFYALMLGRIQQRPPEHFLVTNGEQATTQYQYLEYEDLLLKSIEQANRIRGGWMPPAVYGNGAPPWSNYCNEIAIRNEDVSLIPGIGASRRVGMMEAGFDTVRNVASSSAAELQQIKGVGKKRSVEYLESARAISSGKCVRKAGPIDLPERSTEIFLDLEGLNAVFDGTLSDYLIGALVRTNGAETYHSFVAEGKREDEMLKSFLDFMGGQNDYAIYHWHHYERTHLRSMMGRHGMEAYGLLEPDVMLDLSKIATGAFAFPTYSNSIKDIAKWLGFKWRHDNVGAMSATELYLKYAEDPKPNLEGMRMVLDYNEDDCVATRVIKDWLVSVRE